MELNRIICNLIYTFIKYKFLSCLINELSNSYGLFNTFFIMLFIINYINYFELRY